MNFATRYRLAACSALLLVVSVVGLASAEVSLYQRLGGQRGVAQIVDNAYAIFLADDRIKADFDNINPAHIKPRFAALICQLADGPCVYKGRPMAAAHEGLALTRAKFNAVAEDLQTAMGQLGVPYWTQNRLMALLAPMQRDIVTQ